MRAVALLTAAAMATVMMAGCLDDSNDSPDADPNNASGMNLYTASGKIPAAPDQSMFIGTVLNDHALGLTGHIGHQLPELHTDSHNFDLLDHNDLSSELLGPGSGYLEVHVAGDLAVVGSIMGSRGATLVDISNPNEMEVLSHIYNLDDNWDSRLSEDGRYLFLGCQGSAAFDCTTIITEGEGQGTEGGLVCAPLVTCQGGIAVFDLIEPRNPIYIDFLPMGFTHNVYAFQHDNGNYYVMNEGVTIAEWNPEERSFMVVNEGTIPGVHDVAIQRHPVTNDWLMYTGAGNLMSIWNLNDPSEPILVGSVEEGVSGADIPAMWHEQTPMPCLIDGRHITIGAGESGGGIAQPIAIVDTTNPAAPIYLGQWQLPDAASLTAQQSYRFSLHNIDGNCDGQVAVGHYHAGVWVFDISTPERMAEPVTLAYYKPHERVLSPSMSPVNTAPIGAFVSLDQPNVWTAQWSADGQTLFIPDMVSGLYALQPTWEFEA